MKKKLFIFSISLFIALQLNAQTTTFDNLNANPLTNKAITWTSSNYGSGFGHRIINSDPGGQTLLNFQGRHNTTTWSDFMTITSTGKIGIGTTSPSEKLHINGSIRGNSTGGALRVNTDSGYIDIGSQNTSFAHIYTDRPKVIFNKPIYTTTNIFSSYNNDLILQTEGNTRLTINDDSGNVGIGTTTPEHKLHVSTGVRFRKTTIGVTSASNENSWVRDDWLTGNYGPAKWDQSIEKWVRPSGTYNDIGGILYQDEGTYFLRDRPGTELEYTNSEFLNTAYMFAHMYSGNIGIGTTTPDSKLTVAGKIHAQEVKVTVDAGADFVFHEDYN